VLFSISDALRLLTVSAENAARQRRKSQSNSMHYSLQ